MKPNVISIMVIIFILTSCRSRNTTAVFKENEIGTNNIDYSSLRNSIPLKAPTRIKAMTNEISEYDTVSGIFEGYHYTLYPEGLISLQIDGKIHLIKLKTEDIISEAHFYSYKGDLIIYYTDTDMDVSGSFVECFDKDFHLKWRQNMGGFNLTDPAIVDSISFVASIGFVGKLNLNNGEYFWQHNDLYDTTRFDSFRSISFDGEKVIFYGWKGMDDNPGKVIVNNKTGEILEITKNAI
jgi:hypothetical protein